MARRIRTGLDWTLERRFPTRRVRKGVREARFGGYATWTDRSGKYRRKEVFVWLRADLVDDDCGKDTETVVNALTAKARKRWPKAEVNESWRY